MLGPQAHAQGAAPFVLQTVDFQESCDFLLLRSHLFELKWVGEWESTKTEGHCRSRWNGFRAFLPEIKPSTVAGTPTLGDGIRGSKTSLLSTLPWLLQAYSSIHHPWTAKGVHKNQELKHHYITLAFFCHQKDPEFWFWQRSPFAGQPISLASKLANVALLPGNILDQPGEAIGKCCFQSQLVGEMLVRD